MPEYQYAISEGGYIRCCNCEAIKGDPHTPECTGGSLLGTVGPSGSQVQEKPSPYRPAKEMSYHALKAHREELDTRIGALNERLREVNSELMERDKVG